MLHATALLLCVVEMARSNAQQVSTDYTSSTSSSQTTNDIIRDYNRNQSLVYVIFGTFALLLLGMLCILLFCPSCQDQAKLDAQAKAARQDTLASYANEKGGYQGQ